MESSLVARLRAELVAELRKRAHEIDAGGEPFKAAVWRECARDIESAGRGNETKE